MDSNSFTGFASDAAEVGLNPLEAGQEIDGFKLEERLHQGGMATLWRVSILPDTPQGAKLAAKVTPGMPLIMKVPRIKGGETPPPSWASRSSA
ncbi:hypothetical protein [Ideonella paludis]|uniref:hypothetical protein n=1 Tax=Ideonella paludis TaxID=1233411 RepID=UPI0036257ABB